MTQPAQALKAVLIALLLMAHTTSTCILSFWWSGIVWMFLTFFYLSSYARFKNEQVTNY